MRTMVDPGPKTPSIGWAAMAERWQPLDTLLGGTLAMRSAGEKYLPRHDKEDLRKYDERLACSVLFPAYKDGLESAVSKPFSKEVTYEGDLPPDLLPLWEDMDRMGHNATWFMRAWWREAVHRGLSHILVDTPRVPAANLEDQRQRGVRPYCVHITPDRLFGWKFDDAGRLLQIRYSVTRLVPDGTYGEKEEEHVRVLTVGSEPGQSGTWQEFKLGDKTDWTLVSEGPLNHPDGIPLVTLYTEQVGPMLARPPLEQLGWLNVRHWQSDSDQQDLLRFARVGVWFASGWNEKELKAGLTIGAHRFVGSTNTDAKLTVVEHSGKAIEIGAADLATLEGRMRDVLQDTLTKTPGDVKATAHVLGERRQESTIGAWVQAGNQALRKVFELAGRWMDPAVELPETWQPRIFADFVMSLRGTEDLKTLTEMRANGDISRQTMFEEMQRRSFLSPNVTSEEEEDRLAEESATMPRMAPSEPPADRMPMNGMLEGGRMA